MRIRFRKKGTRCKLVCERTDGSVDISDTGANVPFHDFAHFVVEQRLGIQRGFFGNIALGYSAAQLSDKAVIKTLPADALLAEISARALQSLYSGACAKTDFFALINQELESQSIGIWLPENGIDTDLLVSEYSDIVNAWQVARDGESLELEFKPQNKPSFKSSSK